jgi:4-methylaminobutanoate oxidase (formaldehyde-forming)
VPTRHQLYITRPLSGVSAEQPIVRVLDVNVYVRPERGGLLVGGYEPDPLQVDVKSLGADFDMKSLTLDFEPLRKLTAPFATSRFCKTRPSTVRGDSNMTLTDD